MVRRRGQLELISESELARLGSFERAGLEFVRRYHVGQGTLPRVDDATGPPLQVRYGEPLLGGRHRLHLEQGAGVSAGDSLIIELPAPRGGGSYFGMLWHARVVEADRSGRVSVECSDGLVAAWVEYLDFMADKRAFEVGTPSWDKLTRQAQAWSPAQSAPWPCWAVRAGR